MLRVKIADRPLTLKLAGAAVWVPTVTENTPGPGRNEVPSDLWNQILRVFPTAVAQYARGPFRSRLPSFTAVVEPPDQSPGPMALTARTLVTYWLPQLRPVMVVDVAVPT